MADLITTLRFIRDGGHTLRYHTVARIEPEYVGQHSFGVAWLCYLLTGGTPSAALLVAAMGHDLAEHQYGDIPAPTKSRLKISTACADMEGKLMDAVDLRVPPLSAVEGTVLRLADLMDGMLSCVRERLLGNRLVTACYENYEALAWEALPRRGHGGVVRQELAADNPRAVALLDVIDTMWREANE